MFQKIKELYSFRDPFFVREPRMFMKTKEIVELTWNVTENKRVVRSSWSVFRATPYPHVGEPRMFMKINQIVELT